MLASHNSDDGPSYLLSIDSDSGHVGSHSINIDTNHNDSLSLSLEPSSLGKMNPSSSPSLSIDSNSTSSAPAPLSTTMDTTEERKGTKRKHAETISQENPLETAKKLNAITLALFRNFIGDLTVGNKKEKNRKINNIDKYQDITYKIKEDYRKRNVNLIPSNLQDAIDKINALQKSIPKSSKEKLSHEEKNRIHSAREALRRKRRVLSHDYCVELAKEIKAILESANLASTPEYKLNDELLFWLTSIEGKKHRDTLIKNIKSITSPDKEEKIKSSEDIIKLKTSYQEFVTFREEAENEKNKIEATGTNNGKELNTVKAIRQAKKTWDEKIRLRNDKLLLVYVVALASKLDARLSLTALPQPKKQRTSSSHSAMNTRLEAAAVRAPVIAQASAMPAVAATQAIPAPIVRPVINEEKANPEINELREKASISIGLITNPAHKFILRDCLDTILAVTPDTTTKQKLVVEYLSKIFTAVASVLIGLDKSEDAVINASKYASEFSDQCKQINTPSAANASATLFSASKPLPSLKSTTATLTGASARLV